MALFCLLALLASPPVTLDADRIEIDPEGMRATGLRLTRDGLELRAPRAHGRRTADCARGDWTLERPVELRGPRLDAAADGARLCLPTGRMHIARLRLHTPDGRLRAEQAELRGDRIKATGVEATGCACADPPWSVTARAASVTRGGAWVQWPVLRLSGLPVLAAPAWYVPLVRRRSGLLAPTLGFDAEDGLYGTLPIFLTLGQSADLTLAPGWRDGIYGTGRLRWAATPDEGGALHVQSQGTTDLRAFGAGSLPLGGARLAADGELTTDIAARRRLARTLPLRSRDHLRSAAVAHVTGELASAGVRVTRLHGLTDGAAPWIPEAWLGWAVPIGPTTLRLDGRYLDLRGADGGPAWLDLDGQLDGTFWLGPLRVRPVAGATMTERLDADLPQTSSTWVGAEAELLASRRFGDLRHLIGVRVDGRAANASGERPERSLPFDQPLASRAAGIALVNRLSGTDTTADLTVRYGGDQRRSVEPLSAHAHVEAGWLSLSGSVAGTGTHWSRVRVEPVEGFGLRGGHARIGSVERLPNLWSTGIERPWLLATDAEPLMTTTAGLFLQPGRLRVAYDLMLDVRGEQVLGQWGSATWDGRCDCWRIGVQASHESGRAWPDVLATLQLGRL